MHQRDEFSANDLVPCNGDDLMTGMVKATE